MLPACCIAALLEGEEPKETTPISEEKGKSTKEEIDLPFFVLYFFLFLFNLRSLGKSMSP